MGLMFSRRRSDAAKEHKANKAKAHEKNQADAKAKFGEPSKAEPKKAVPDGADKLGAK